jgi:methylated-DNA-[protein]-cysteine S-methyltransferase
MGHGESTGVSFALLRDTPLGPVAVWATRHGVRRIGFVDREFVERHQDEESPDEAVGPVVSQLREYFAGRRQAFDVPIDLSGATPFQRRIYQRLQKIPCGRVVSYGDLADELGEPGAARAVGQAVGANPLPVIVPCHRVVRSDGRLGGYSGGLHRKVALLSLEGVDAEGPHAGSRVHPEVLRLGL